MCGFACLFAYSAAAPPVDPCEATRMSEAMLHRGPDGNGLWVSPDRRVAMAHRRLAIVDLTPDGDQPMSYAKGAVRIVFNGEIYNYRQLRADLEHRGYEFASTSDTEVLLALYREKGKDMVADLRGMYAFAIWDEVRQGIFLARYPFGIKPLYFSDDGHTFRAASQVKALLAGGAIDNQPEPAGHVGFFLFGHVPEPYTLYKTIRALPAGSHMWVAAGAMRDVVTFWSPLQALSDGLATSTNAATDSQDVLRNALLDSVRHHLIADVPVGVFLSAGLDSCTITALASELSSGALRTITLGFEEYRDTAADESPLAAQVARAYGAEHHNRRVSRSDFEGELQRLLAAMDQPTINGVNTYFVSRTAAQSGLKVALSGLGGDELFGGYSGFTRIPRMVNLIRRARLPGWLARSLRLVSSPLFERFGKPKYAAALELGSTVAGGYFLTRSLFLPWELDRFFEPDFLSEGLERLEIIDRLEKSIAGAEDDRCRISLLEMQWYMRNQLLRDSDWAGMANSVEIRVPFVDVMLWKTVACLGRTAGWPGKQAAASTPSKQLPAEVLNRPKTGFGIPVRDWIHSMVGGHPEASLRTWAKFVYNTFVSDVDIPRAKSVEVCST